MQPDVSLIDIYLFPTGRRLFCLGNVLAAIAPGEEEAPLRARVEEAIAFDRNTRALELRYAGNVSDAQHAPEAPGVDAEIDRTLNAIDSSVANNMRAFPPGDPIHVSSRVVRAKILPLGAGPITTLGYVLELETVGALLREAAAPELAAHISAANVRPHFDRLGDLHAKFQPLVGVGQTDAIGFDKVRAARASGQRQLARIVAWVLGHYLEDTEADIAARARLLGPILEQNEIIRLQHASHRAVTDVDSDTGVEVNPTGPTS